LAQDIDVDYADRCQRDALSLCTGKEDASHFLDFSSDSCQQLPRWMLSVDLVCNPSQAQTSGGPDDDDQQQQALTPVHLHLPCLSIWPGHCRSRPITQSLASDNRQNTRLSQQQPSVAYQPVATGFPGNYFICRPMSNLFVLDLYVLSVTDTH
jgi:hypothetical protein